MKDDDGILAKFGAAVLLVAAAIGTAGWVVVYTLLPYWILARMI